MLLPSFKETLKQTTSRCPECRLPAAAEVWKTTGTPSQVYLTRTCTKHGESTACIASDARFYWLAKGDPANACGAGCACAADPAGRDGTLGRNAAATDSAVEVLSTCLALSRTPRLAASTVSLEVRGQSASRHQLQWLDAGALARPSGTFSGDTASTPARSTQR